MSYPLNRIVRGGPGKSIFESILPVIDETVSMNQGDLIVFDDTNNLLKVPSSEAEFSTFVGVASVTLVDGKIPTGYVTAVDGAQGVSDAKGPGYGDGLIASHILKTGSSLNPGDYVYGSPADGAQVIAASGTKAIGMYVGPAIAGSSAGQTAEWLVGARFPGDTLRF